MAGLGKGGGLFLAAVLLAGGEGRAATPPPAKRLPPAGIAISAADREELTAGAAELGREIAALDREVAATSRVWEVDWPDIEIFHKAVDWALRYDEFFDAKQVPFARHLLAEGRERVAQVRAGRAPWLDATGLVIRGYRSQIDGSIQPFAVVVPADYQPTKDPPQDADPVRGRRLDVVLSGRNEKRTELAFIAEHEKSPGEIVPAEGIVLYPYGRFCNATKFAGEVDVFEAIQNVSEPIDARRVVMRGFSMGGASAWHLAVHHSGAWCAASPGAGFAETAIYSKVFAPGKEPRTWWEQKLWNWYDATAAAGNLFNCPTVAYSGEIDPQKQSADIMEKAMAAEGLKLERLIGPKTAHKYEPATKKVLAARLDALAARGREETPREVRLTTYTLRYPQVAWVRVQGLGRHWDRAEVRARWDGAHAVTAETTNVTAVTFALSDLQEVTIDGQKLAWKDSGEGNGSTDNDGVTLLRDGRQWKVRGQTIDGFREIWSDPVPRPGLSKRPAPEFPVNEAFLGASGTGLTGPIDDAFMSGFVFVRPTGQPLNPKVGAWVQGELAHATKMWRDLFRGEAPAKDDRALTREDVIYSNLILWGDPSSNQILGQIIGRLPVVWDAHRLVFRGRTYDAADHAPILIFPNPLNPTKYVVLNSGMDFRDEAYGSNALQTPKLPDWAIVDLRTPPGPRWPGRIEDAGFFDEQWQVTAP